MSNVNVFAKAVAKVGNPITLVRGRDTIKFEYDGRYIRSAGARVRLTFDSFDKALESFETLTGRGYRVRGGN